MVVRSPDNAVFLARMNDAHSFDGGVVVVGESDAAGPESPVVFAGTLAPAGTLSSGLEEALFEPELEQAAKLSNDATPTAANEMAFMVKYLS
jgi:hypothetical protein